MNPERSIFEKLGKRVGLGGAALLALGQIACAKTEPTRAQAPTPSQTVATEVVPAGSIPESLPAEQPQIEKLQIEECQPTDFMGPITMKGPGGRDVPIGSIKALDERDLRTGPAPDASTFKKVSAGTDLIIVCTNASQRSMLVQIPNQQISGWVREIPEIEPLLRAAAPKIPEPTVAPELVRFFQEISVLDVYSGELLIMSGEQRGKFGNILISRLPDNRILVGYNRLKPCEDGRKPTPIFLVRSDNVRGAGFQWNSPQEDLVVLLQGPSLGGQIRTKDLARENLTCTGNPEPAVYSAKKQERGGTPTGLFTALSRMLSEADPRMTPESVKNIVERLYGGPLPDSPAK